MPLVTAPPPPILSKLILYEYSLSNVANESEDPLLRRKVERFVEGMKVFPWPLGSEGYYGLLMMLWIFCFACLLLPGRELMFDWRVVFSEYLMLFTG